jgi:N-acetylglucosamine kinase-like BadF-type ATPase
LNELYLLGVDGGGSKTEAWVARLAMHARSGEPRLEVIGRSVVGPANPRANGFTAACAEIARAIEVALDKAAVPAPAIAAGCLSLAGAGRQAEQATLQAWASQYFSWPRIVVVDDVAPLRDAAAYEQWELGDTSLTHHQKVWEQSITLISGTGSIACGMDSLRRQARAGGWGYLLGDEGSGFALGMAGLKQLCQSYDRTGRVTPLGQRMLDHLQLQEPTQLIEYLYAGPLPRREIASLSAIILKTASQDPEAALLCQAAIHQLVDLVSGLQQRLALRPGMYRLALSGGLFKHHPDFVSCLLGELDRRGQAPAAYHVVQHPLWGVLLTAAELIDR